MITSIFYLAKFSSKIVHLLAIACCLSMLSCDKPDLTVEKPNENLRPAADFVNNNFEMTLFSAALKKVGLYEELNGAGPYTLLVPTDEAFNEVGVFRASDFDSMDQDSLKRVMSYHILPRRLRDQDIPINSADIRYKTMEGSELYATYANYSPDGNNVANKLFFSGAQATRKDVTLSNGVLYSIRKLMKPQFEVSLQAWLIARSEYSVFIAGLKKFGLWDQLAEHGPYTVFAPTNDALAKIGITEESLGELKTEGYNGEMLFGCYVIKGKHFFVSDSDAFATIATDGGYMRLAGDGVRGIQFGSTVFFNKITYTLTLYSVPSISAGRIEAKAEYDVEAKMDYLCSNGVIHNLEQGFITVDLAQKDASL
ncbi:MAG: fasciclin domain-containing protein [Sphingobacterium sp.]|uniref:fasciclin domain-containing protein n=1 Tax=Sphingobacterium sp. TaxID=341027 RepID=UPI0028462052|nr:fasciclin domain-containing protein [Sphingobacterium sp.]MDR3010737.1 fasciclin domain-containing protein [Sphingobacterium sp.]